MTADADFLRGQTVANELLEARRELDALRDRIALDKSQMLAQVALAAEKIDELLERAMKPENRVADQLEPITVNKANAARLLQISESQLDKIVRHGELSPVRFVDDGYPMYLLSDLREFAESRKAVPAP